MCQLAHSLKHCVRSPKRSVSRECIPIVLRDIYICNARFVAKCKKDNHITHRKFHRRRPHMNPDDALPQRANGFASPHTNTRPQSAIPKSCACVSNWPLSNIYIYTHTEVQLNLAASSSTAAYIFTHLYNAENFANYPSTTTTATTTMLAKKFRVWAFSLEFQIWIYSIYMCIRMWLFLYMFVCDIVFKIII